MSIAIQVYEGDGVKNHKPSCRGWLIHDLAANSGSYPQLEWAGANDWVDHKEEAIPFPTKAAAIQWRRDLIVARGFTLSSTIGKQYVKALCLVKL